MPATGAFSGTPASINAKEVPQTVAIANRFVGDAVTPLTVEAVEKYYAEDKRIWTVFLAFRRLDRWLNTHLLHRRYEFILPGAIQR